jgi:hypothetical protein
VTCPPRRKPRGTERRRRKIPCTLPSKTKRDSGSIIRFIGGSIGIVCVIVIVSVTGDRAGEVFLGGHEEGCD